jgi:glycogen debranching enzyme
MTVSYETDGEAPPPPTPVEKAFDHALSSTRTRPRVAGRSLCRVLSASAMFNRWLTRSSADLQIMLTDTPHGSYPYAGHPWFSTPFGRDGLNHGLRAVVGESGESLAAYCRFFADTQATSVRRYAGRAAGKESFMRCAAARWRRSVKCRSGAYYGSVDSTPLFVMLAYAYYERTADREFIDRIWPNIGAALEWMLTSGDPDEDGFLDYARKTGPGAAQSGMEGFARCDLP